MSATLELTLPGQWQALPLGDDDQIAAEVAAFVKAHFGRRDDHALLRGEQRARLSETARRARDAGARQFHMSLTAPGGIALASTVAEYRPTLPLGALTEPAAVADALVRVLAARAEVAAGGSGGSSGADGAEAADGAHWEAFSAAGGVVFDRGDGLVLRTSRRLDSDAEGVETVIVDYWLTVPGAADVALVSFTTALAPLEPVITELFDAIVATAAWPAADAGDSSSLRASLLR